VNVGKNITKDLSIHYSMGLAYPVSVLNLVYSINRHLKLQAEASTIENGADLVYSLERN
jgi:autotransporter translocation and assembly factor TamB